MREEAADSGEPTRILLVGGDPRTATLITAMLQSAWGSRLVLAQAELLGDALKELLDHGADCVLLDDGGVDAGTGDAISALEEMRAAAPEVALLVLLERGDDELEDAAIRAGAQDCLIKPELGPAHLRRAVLHAIERQHAEAVLAHQALHDPLTGLPNRALFLDRLGVALDRSRRTHTQVAVLFLDVDNFKGINDSLGHAAGDTVLAGLAGRLQRMLRPMDTVARFGGDEFTFLFEELSSEREVVLIAERIIRATAAPIAVAGRDASVTVSIGITVVRDPTLPVESVLREADIAMYRAKEQGRSRYELFDESSRSRATERQELEEGLRHALERGELRVHYQPRVTLDGAIEVVGFEALVRWEHPERGLIAPEAFIPLAEEIGLVNSIGQFVVEQALTQVERWRRSSPGVTVSVNLSPRQLEDPGLPSLLRSVVEASGSDPSVLCLEITERALGADDEAPLRSLRALKSLGVQLAIDDYGTGSSLLSTLRRLPIDVLKIHETFVSGVGTDGTETTLVRAVIDLGHALGLRVLAEGVETEDQLEQLQALGCDCAQGYLFSAAIPEQEVNALLLSG